MHVAKIDRRSIQGFPLLFLLATMITTQPLCAADVQTIELRRVGDDGQREHGYGNSQWLNSHEASPEPEIEWPEFRSAAPVFFAAKYGDAEDNVHSMAIDDSGQEGKKYDILYADANNDNRIDPERERFEFQFGGSSDNKAARVKFMVTVGEVTSPYYASFSAFQLRRQANKSINATLRDSSYYVGEAEFAGKRLNVAVLDLNSNGMFNDPEPKLFKGDRIGVDLDGNGHFSTFDDPLKTETFALSRYIQITGVWYTFLPSADGLSLKISEADPPLGKIEAHPHIQSMLIRSGTQTQNVLFSGGKAEAIVGAYEIEKIELASPKFNNLDWKLVARFKNERPKIIVTKDQTLKLKRGEPFEVRLEIAPEKRGRSLLVTLQVLGQGGELYNSSEYQGRVAQPGFIITDSKNRPIAFGAAAQGGRWTIPKSLTGKYQIWPVIDLPGLEFETVAREVEFRDGGLVEDSLGENQ